jgi:hypothetical protein
MNPNHDQLYRFALALPEEERLELAHALLAASAHPPTSGPSIKGAGPNSPPGIPDGGWLPNDEVTQDWLRCIQEYRDQCDKEDRARILGDSEEGCVHPSAVELRK